PIHAVPGQTEVPHDRRGNVDQPCDTMLHGARGEAAAVGDQEGVALEVAEPTMAAEAFRLAGLVVADADSDLSGYAERVGLGTARHGEGDGEPVLRPLAEMEHFGA